MTVSESTLSDKYISLADSEVYQKNRELVDAVVTFMLEHDYDIPLAETAARSLVESLEECDEEFMQSTSLKHVLAIAVIVQTVRENEKFCDLRSTGLEWFASQDMRMPRKFFKMIGEILPLIGGSLAPVKADTFIENALDSISTVTGTRIESSDDMQDYLHVLEPSIREIVDLSSSDWIGKGLAARTLVCAAIILADRQGEGRFKGIRRVICDRIGVNADSLYKWTSHLKSILQDCS